MATRVNAENFRTIRDARREAAILKETESGCVADGRRAWAEYGSGVSAYNETFAGVLDKPLIATVTEMRERNSEITGMDFMGEGQVLRELMIDRGLALTLADHRDATKKKYDSEHGISLLSGEVLSPKTWQEIKEWLGQQETSDKQGFDIILARPIGGLLSLPFDVNFYYRIFNNLYKLLNRDSGLLLFQMALWPGKVENFGKEGVAARIIDRWRDALKRTNGIESEYSRTRQSANMYALKIKKGKNAPENLPSINLEEFLI
ncbi:MAG: hypothetical protein V1898_01985 [Patescibacteria group bacterium]